MPPTLVALPTELLEMIAGITDTWKEDPILALRATCRELRYKLEQAFTAEYFTSRYVRLSLEKLNELKDISMVPTLAARTTTIEVICRPDLNVDNTHGDKDDIRSLFDRASKTLAAALATLLRRFPKLKTIDFIDMRGEDTALSTFTLPSGVMDISTTFLDVMAAIDEHGIKPNSIEMTGEVALLRTNIHGLSLLRSCFSMLETLELSIMFPPDVNGIDMGSCLSSILLQSPKLKNLSLGMAFSEAAGDAFHSLAVSARLQHLQHLSIRRSLCTSADLALLLLAHAATLQKCCLIFLNITGDHPTAIPDLMNVMREKLRLNRVVLNRLNAEQERAVFSGMGKTVSRESPQEEEWIEEVHSDEFVELEGYDEVHEGLAQARRCVTYTALS
ncbi:hypothetical protein LTR17_013743 [Elasticomyces elasticus]|nr:hypothetical protein LTR17_013743 [Elasticomyces elasticus]